MRRGIGVAHIQQQRQTQQKMADLGAQITAERVGDIANQLEALEQQLRSLAQRHKEDIKHDPVVRARFRQLADSLGVDLISSKKNIFAGLLGLGDFYYALASKIVEACMQERKFCGSYVPLPHVLRSVRKSYESAVTSSNSKRTEISEEDVLTALSKLLCLGGGYNVVELGGTRFIQVTPDGARGRDEIPLINLALAHQKKQMEAARQKAIEERSALSKPGMPQAPVRRRADRTLIGAAYALGVHPIMVERNADDVDIPLSAQYVVLTSYQVAQGLNWPHHRAHAALQRMVQDGSVWVDYPARKKNGMAHSASHALHATETKEVWRSGKHSTEELDSDAEYWFLSLTASAA